MFRMRTQEDGPRLDQVQARLVESNFFSFLEKSKRLKKKVRIITYYFSY